MNLFAQARKKHYLCSRKGEGYVRYILIVFGQNWRHFANLPNTLISTLSPLLDPYLTLTQTRQQPKEKRIDILLKPKTNILAECHLTRNRISKPSLKMLAVILSLRPYSDRAHIVHTYTRACGRMNYMVYGLGKKKSSALYAVRS